MGNYGDFIEAYKKAYPHTRKKLQYEQANKLWGVLKMKPEEFEQRFHEKMSELKLLETQNLGKNMKIFTQSKLSFGNVKPKVSASASASTSASAALENQVVQQKNLESTGETSGQLNIGSFLETMKMLLFSILVLCRKILMTFLSKKN